MAVDRINSSEYNEFRVEFMDILTEEEAANAKEDLKTSESTFSLSSSMNRAWETGTFWYSLALTSPTGLFALFDKEIQPKMTAKSPDHEAFHEIMPWYWAKDIPNIVRCKLADKKAYDLRLQEAFEEALQSEQ